LSQWSEGVSVRRGERKRTAKEVSYSRTFVTTAPLRTLVVRRASACTWTSARVRRLKPDRARWSQNEPDETLSGAGLRPLLQAKVVRYQAFPSALRLAAGHGAFHCGLWQMSGKCHRIRISASDKRRSDTPGLTRVWFTHQTRDPPAGCRFKPGESPRHSVNSPARSDML
jgi:hypothetical protein